MINLKKDNYSFILFLLLLSGCASKPFKVINQVDYAVEIKVTPDRVLLECEYQYDNDTKGLYGFLMHVLDEENTVLTVAQMNSLDKTGCSERNKKIGKILSKGKSIYIGATGNLSEERVKEMTRYIFPGIGTFHGNGHVLQFIVIANENGLCYDAYHGEDKPCPRDTFPLKGKKVAP